MGTNHATFFHPFQSDISELLPKPAAFTFPFYYEPHPLSIQAATELQQYLESQQDFVHNFGLGDMPGTPIGKMFGVLVAENAAGELGYLAACSGKLAGTNQHRYFVPPVFDMLTKNSFFLQEEEQINALNREISALENTKELPILQEQLKELEVQANKELSDFRKHLKAEKAKRKAIRTEKKALLSDSDYTELEADLVKQSYRDQHEQALLKQQWKEKLDEKSTAIQQYLQAIEAHKSLRKEKSAALQQRLFEQYRFLNAQGEIKDVCSIFTESKQIVPPAGAGECAAPKLLQYAYQHNLKPICMAEFWWGASPSSEVRKHKSFYPACKSKCEPILGHMLQGLEVEANPMLENPALGRDFEVIYEDQDILVINKPAEFLSVPGIHISDSVYTRVLENYPDITGPVIIHRLDMSTSGILVLAKNKEAHQFIQQQFINHQVHKRYTALLDGIVEATEGLIDLPLRVDLDDRPRQVVCYEYGKTAQTRYKVQGYEQGRTRIHFYPLTGRTHQLRVHAAHQKGLHTAIVGDDLYGQRADRLHLHAGHIAFIHPQTKKLVAFELPDPF